MLLNLIGIFEQLCKMFLSKMLKQIFLESATFLQFQKIKVAIDDHVVERIAEAEFFGVTMDHKISWKPQS